MDVRLLFALRQQRVHIFSHTQVRIIFGLPSQNASISTRYFQFLSITMSFSDAYTRKMTPTSSQEESQIPPSIRLYISFLKSKTKRKSTTVSYSAIYESGQRKFITTLSIFTQL